MQWHEVCADRSLQNLPYKIELNREGQIVMSPAQNRYAILQGRLQRLLNRLLQERGEVMPECAIETFEGIKVADVVWLSAERYQLVKDQDAYKTAPELCIEIMSNSNSEREMQTKVRLYLESGALEVWIVDSSGHIRFFDATEGERQQGSALLSTFPTNVPID